MFISNGWIISIGSVIPGRYIRAAWHVENNPPGSAHHQNFQYHAIFPINKPSIQIVYAFSTRLMTTYLASGHSYFPPCPLTSSSNSQIWCRSSLRRCRRQRSASWRRCASVPTALRMSNAPRKGERRSTAWREGQRIASRWRMVVSVEAARLRRRWGWPRHTIAFRAAKRNNVNDLSIEILVGTLSGSRSFQCAVTVN